jgi:hypothetical protein
MKPEGFGITIHVGPDSGARAGLSYLGPRGFTIVDFVLDLSGAKGSGKMSVHERADIECQRTEPATDLNRLPGPAIPRLQGNSWPQFSSDTARLQDLTAIQLRF